MNSINIYDVASKFKRRNHELLDFKLIVIIRTKLILLNNLKR